MRSAHVQASSVPHCIAAVECWGDASLLEISSGCVAAAAAGNPSYIGLANAVDSHGIHKGGIPEALRDVARLRKRGDGKDLIRILRCFVKGWGGRSGHSVAREGERLGIKTTSSDLPHGQQQYLKNLTMGGEGSDPHDPTIGVVFAIILTPWPEDEFCETDLKCVVGKLDTDFSFMCNGNNLAGSKMVDEAMELSMFDRNNSPTIIRYNMLRRDHPGSKEFAELRNKVFMDLVKAPKMVMMCDDDDGDIEH